MDIENRERIIAAADELFMRLGIRSVSMDDVARELAVSKKTLYQYFDNKDSLVTAVSEQHLETERKEFTEIQKVATNAIDELHLIARCLRDHISKLNPSTLHDLRKYHIKAWNCFLDFKNEFIKGHVIDNIVRGIEEGYYRPEMDAEVLAIFRVEQVQMMFDSKIYPPAQFDHTHVQMQLFDHFVHGLLTEEGKKLYEKSRKLATI